MYIPPEFHDTEDVCSREWVESIIDLWAERFYRYAPWAVAAVLLGWCWSQL